MAFFNALIAPCGINCGVCLAYLRKKNKCPGCLSVDCNKPQYCLKCRIKHCDKFNDSTFSYCFDCPKFPCTRLKRLNKRYIEKYSLSLIGNLNDIQKHGFDQFINNENEKWKCRQCGEVLCVHRSFCLHCKKER